MVDPDDYWQGVDPVRARPSSPPRGEGTRVQCHDSQGAHVVHVDFRRQRRMSRPHEPHKVR